MELREQPAISNILSRRSVRRFDSRMVEGEAIEIMLECACAAPSAANTRPWSFLVIDNRDLLGAVADAHPYGKMLGHAPLAIVVCGDISKNEISKDYWEKDCSAAMQNILLAANALGLGSVWLGVQPKEREDQIREVLGIPKKMGIVGIAAIGYPFEKVPPLKKGIDAGAVHRNCW